MGYISCRRCGKEWDSYYVSYEMAPPEMIAFRQGNGCPRCRGRGIHNTWEKEMAWSSITESLDEISTHYTTFTSKYAQGRKKANVIVARSDTMRDLEDFFISCQRAEERIKLAAMKGFISRDDVGRLNVRIGNVVSSVLTMSQSTPRLADSITELAEVRPTVMGVLQLFTSPDLYRAFQYFIRQRQPADQPPLYRTMWERGM